MNCPDVLDRIEFGGFRWEGDDGDVGRHDEARRHMPACLIDQGTTAFAISARCRFIASVLQVGRIRAAPLPCFGPDRAEDVGGSGALVAGRTWAGAALRPAAGDLVLLADTSLICEPDFYRVDADRLLTRDCVQARGKLF